MQKAIKNLLRNNDLTIRQISSNFKISRSTLSYNLNKPYKKWTLSLLNIVANATHNTRNQLIADLEHNGFYMNTNDREQKIQDISIPSEAAYFNIKASAMNSYFEGWKPSSQDIKDVVQQYYHPNKELRDTMNSLFQAMKKYE